MAIPHLKSLAIFGLAAACATGGVGTWVLLRAPQKPAEIAAHVTESVGEPPSPASVPSKAELPEDEQSSSHPVDSGRDHQAESDRSHTHPSRKLADDAVFAEEGLTDPQASASSGQKKLLTSPARLTEKQEKKRVAEILRADDELREGRLAVAMKLYGASIEAHPTVLDPVVQFRWALCAESLGLLDEAAERYQMLASATTSPAWKGFARWGLARVLLEQQKFEPAHRIAVDLWLNQDQLAPLWRPELLHWHAHVAYRRTLGSSPARLTDDNVFTSCRLVVRPAELLEIGTRIHAAETGAPFSTPAAAAVPQSSGHEPESIYAQFKSGGASVFDAVTQFAAAARWTAHWSPGAEQLARTSRTPAAVPRASIACLLDALCENPRLIWTWQDGQLFLSAVTERSSAEASEHLVRAANRAAREALLQFAGGEWSPYSRLAVAHTEQLRAHPAAARQALEDLIANSPKAVLLGESWFNLGKVLLSQDQAGQSITAFERAMDHSMGGVLEPISCLYLGRLYLESNEPRRAVVPLRRAVALTAPRDRGVAALTLGSAYLLSGQPQNTAEILRNNQSHLDVETTRDATAFLSCLAQVQGGHDPTRLKYDLRSLMTAISHVRSDQFFGRSGALLIAIAYRELGLNGEAADICREAIAQMPDCALRMRLQLMLVDELMDRGDLEHVEQQLRTIAHCSNEEVRVSAAGRLTDLLLSQERRDEAEAVSYEWLKTCSTDEQKTAALRSLGRCLQKKGDHLNAALCFSGSLPDSVSRKPIPGGGQP